MNIVFSAVFDDSELGYVVEAQLETLYNKSKMKELGVYPEVGDVFHLPINGQLLLVTITRRHFVFGPTKEVPTKMCLLTELITSGGTSDGKVSGNI